MSCTASKPICSAPAEGFESSRPSLAPDRSDRFPLSPEAPRRPPRRCWPESLAAALAGAIVRAIGWVGVRLLDPWHRYLPPGTAARGWPRSDSRYCAVASSMCMVRAARTRSLRPGPSASPPTSLVTDITGSADVAIAGARAIPRPRSQTDSRTGGANPHATARVFGAFAHTFFARDGHGRSRRFRGRRNRRRAILFQSSCSPGRPHRQPRSDADPRRPPRPAAASRRLIAAPT